MTDPRARARAIQALPLEEQREPLLALYRELYAAYGSDWETNTVLMADDYEFIARGTTPLPGLPDRFVGRDGYLEAQRQLREVIEVLRTDVDDVIPLDEGRVVSLSRIVFRAGGTEFEQQLCELHEIEDGLLRRHNYWFDRGEGLRELGL